MAAWLEGMERLVRERERALLGYAYLVCGDPHRAQDLVQDALVKTFSRPREGLTPAKAEAYVRRAITTIYVDQYRRQQRWSRVQHLFRPDVGQSRRPRSRPQRGCRDRPRRPPAAGARLHRLAVL